MTRSQNRPLSNIARGSVRKSAGAATEEKNALRLVVATVEPSRAMTRTFPFVASTISSGPTAMLGLGGTLLSNGMPGKLWRSFKDTVWTTCCRSESCVEATSSRMRLTAKGWSDRGRSDHTHSAHRGVPAKNKTVLSANQTKATRDLVGRLA